MKPSQFNVLIPRFPSTDEYLIFNTFTDSRVVINQSMKEAMESAPNASILSLEGQKSLETLKELGIMVDDDVDEDKELDYWFQKMKFDTSVFDVTILTTSACNLACTYCYQDGIDLKRYMREDTSRSVINWINDRMEDIRPKVLHLTLFGGEPLLNPKAAIALSRSLYESTQERGVHFQISMITNGVLLTEEIVEELVKNGLSKVKITLDGDEKAHDAKRLHRNGKGSFKTIIDKMLMLKGKVPISIGGNFDDSTKHSIPRLLDHLVALGFTSDDITDIKFKPILAATNTLPVLNNAADSGHVCTFSDINVEDLLWLRNEVENHGFRSPDGIAIGPCCATKEQTFTIDPWGNIYKCPALVGREEFRTGHVNDHDSTHMNTRFMTVDLWKDPFCSGCTYRPICGGGCRGSSQTQSGDFQAVACEKPYFETVALELVKQEYTKEISAQEVPG